MKKILMIAFLGMVFVQWLIPGNIIWKNNRVLKYGKSFRFLTEPIDPTNPFKGKYIVLNYKETEWHDASKSKYEYGQEVFVHLQVDKNGYATIAGLSITEPEIKTDYVKARINYTTEVAGITNVYINYPFEEFYMDEFKAPRAEELYREVTTDSTQKAYALIKIWKGTGIIHDVFINDIPIIEWLRKNEK